MPASVVEYKGWREGYRCGYCGWERGKVSAGKREEVGRDGLPGLLWRERSGGARPPSLKMEEFGGVCGDAAAAARGKDGGLGASCGRCPCSARSKDGGGGGRFRASRGAVWGGGQGAVLSRAAGQGDWGGGGDGGGRQLSEHRRVLRRRGWLPLRLLQERERQPLPRCGPQGRAGREGSGPGRAGAAGEGGGGAEGRPGLGAGREAVGSPGSLAWRSEGDPSGVTAKLCKG